MDSAVGDDERGSFMLERSCDSAFYSVHEKTRLTVFGKGSVHAPRSHLIPDGGIAFPEVIDLDMRGCESGGDDLFCLDGPFHGAAADGADGELSDERLDCMRLAPASGI